MPSPQLDTSLTLTSTISTVGLLPVSLDQSQQEQACFRWWVVLPLGGKVQEGARASSSHTICPPYSGSQFAKPGTCVHPGMTWSFGQTSRLSEPLYFTFPNSCVSGPEDQQLFGPTVYWALYPCCTDMGTAQRACGTSPGPRSMWAAAGPLLHDPCVGLLLSRHFSLSLLITATSQSRCERQRQLSGAWFMPGAEDRAPETGMRTRRWKTRRPPPAPHSCSHHLSVASRDTVGAPMSFR